MFDAQRLHKRFGHQVVLEDVSMTFEEGRLCGIMGPNGAGKTTCFNLLTGRYRPDLGWVPDDRRIFPTLTVERNLAIAKKRTRFRAWSARECFEIFSALEYLRWR